MADSGHDSATPDAGDQDAGAIDAGDSAVVMPDAGDSGMMTCGIDQDCPPRSCHEANCALGECMYTPQPFGLANNEPQTDHDCVAIYCDGLGNTIPIPDMLDVPLDDGEPCTVEGCSNSTPTHAPVQNGTELPQDEQIEGDCRVKRCMGGMAVDATNNADIPASTQCADGTCNNGMPMLEPRSAGLDCGTSADQVCDGEGECVACLDQTQSCIDDWQCCGGNCVNGSCGTACAANLADCDGMDNNGCETAVNTPTNCGACGTPCSLANATESCGTGTCVLNACNAGFGNCNNNVTDGCEQSLRTVTDCGACGVPCQRANASATCITLSCSLTQCNAGWGNCDGNNTNGCETATNSLTHCGACNSACAFNHASASCASGSCTLINCDTGFGNCDNSNANGCEASLTSLMHCGGCNTPCTGPANRALSCSTGSCVIGACTPGFQDCDGNVANGCEYNGADCPCIGSDDSDNDGLTNCEEIEDGDAFTDPDIFNGAHVALRTLCATAPFFNVSCNATDTLGEVRTCSNRAPLETLDQHAGWDWDDPSGSPNDVNEAGFGFLPNWTSTNTSWQLDAQAVLNVTQTGRHCFRVNGGSGGSCGSLFIANTDADSFCGWSTLAPDTAPVVQHGDDAVCLQLMPGRYPLRWHLNRGSSAQGDFHLDYCFGGNSDCNPTVALPNRMLRAATASDCEVPANNCTQGIHNGHDYWFCDTALSWSAARTACQGVNMDLTVINNATENTFLTNNIGSDSWIALSDSLSEGTWMWFPALTPIWTGGPSGGGGGGMAVPPNYVHWANGDPNGDNTRNCAELLANGNWNDTTCGTMQSFVCEER